MTPFPDTTVRDRPPAPGHPLPAAAGAPPPVADRVAPRTVFDDLPTEVVCEIGACLFDLAVHDDGCAVKDLACTPRLRHTLRAAGRAEAVLRQIQAATTLAELNTALDEAAGLYARFRPGCLRAAIRLLPRVHPGRSPCDVPWRRLRTLLAACDGQAGGEREALLLELVRTLRVPGSAFPRLDGLLQILQLVEAQAPMGAELADALMRWVGSLHARGCLPAPLRASLTGQLLERSPAALRPRLESLFHLLQGQEGPLVALAAQFGDWQAALAENRPEIAQQLPTLSRRWQAMANASPAFHADYLAFFEQLPPRHQLALLERYRSPLGEHEIVPFLRSLLPRVAPARLLGTIEACIRCSRRPRTIDDAVGLLAERLEASVGTVQLLELMQGAARMWLRPGDRLATTVTRCLQHLEAEAARAVQLTLQLALVGCGEHTPSLVPGRMPALALVDAVLDDPHALHAPAIEALMAANCTWLPAGQRLRLIQRVAQLPPADAARLLALEMSRLAGLQPLQAPGQVLRAAVDAARRLPARHQAAPLAALLDLLPGEPPRFPHLHDAAVAWYHGLPVHLRPHYQPGHAALLWPPAAGPG